MEPEKKETTGGIGVGLGVDLNLRLGMVKDLVHTLNSALRETTGNLTDIISETASKIREWGPQKFKEQASGGYESEYDQLVTDLREAADRGEEEARSLLGEMGESVESAGHSMKEAGEEERH